MKNRNRASDLAMHRRKDANARSDSDVLPDPKAAGRMEESLWPDPRSVADVHFALVVALEDGLVSDVDVPAHVNGGWVEDQDPWLEDAALAARRKICR